MPWTGPLARHIVLWNAVSLLVGALSLLTGQPGAPPFLPLGRR